MFADLELVGPLQLSIAETAGPPAGLILSAFGLPDGSYRTKRSDPHLRDAVRLAGTAR